MALLHSGRRQEFLAMEGNEELEEGEARDSNDSIYGSDLSFPHLELKLTEVLGHVRKEFVDGACNDKQGSCYGGYGTFLPTETRAPYTVPAAPPRQSVAALPPSGTGGTWGGGWRSPHKQQSQPQQQQQYQHHHIVAPTHPGHVVESVAKRPSADGGRDRTSPLLKPKVAPEAAGEPKGTSSITLKIKMGSEATSRAKNTAIYNGLGISSSSVSEEEDDEGLSGAETSPERSPASMIRYMLSQKLPEHLVSPLGDLVPEKSIISRSSAQVAAKEEAVKERRPIKSAKRDKDRVKDSVADDGGGVKDLELDSRPMRQAENDARLRKDKMKGRLNEDTLGADDVARPSLKTPAEAAKSLSARKPDTEFRSLDAPVAEDNFGKHSKTRRDEPAQVDAPLVDKRKSIEADSNRPKKKQKPTGSASSFDMDAPKPRKGPTTPLVGEATFPQHLEATPSSAKPAKENKKEKPVKLSLSKPASASEHCITSKKPGTRTGAYGEEVGPSKVKRVKSKLPKKKDIPEFVPKELAQPPEVAAYGVSVVPLEPVPPVNPPAEPAPLLEDSWAQCEKCNQWRLLPSTVTADNLPEKWICKMITWLPGMNDCRFTEQETTEAVQRTHGAGILLPPLAPTVPMEPEAKQSVPLPKTAKKGLKLDEPYAEGKRKEKGKKRGVRADDTVKDSSERKKKKYQAEETQPSKRVKTEEAHRTKYPEAELFGDEDGEVAAYRSAGQNRKQASKGYDSSSRKDKVDIRRLDRNFDEGTRSRESLEEAEVRKTVSDDAKASSKSFRVEGTKGKAIRVVASGDRDYRNADDWQRLGGNQQQKVKDDEQHAEKKKRRVGSGSASPSESLDGFKERQHQDEAAYESRKMALENHTISAAEYGDRTYRKTLVRDWEEGEEHDEWEGPQQDVKQVSRHRNWPENNERHRDAGTHYQAQEHRDREDPGKWTGRRTSSEGNTEERSRSREENQHSSRHSKNGKSHNEMEENNKPKVRLKQEGPEEQQENFCKYDNKAMIVPEKRELNNMERRRDKAAEVVAEDDNHNNNGTGKDQQGRQSTSKDRRKAVDFGEVKQEGTEKKEATSLIKHAKTLKHLADRDQDTVLYLQAGLKFMEGAALFERTSSSQPEYESWQLYSETAELFRYCADQYERGKDLTGAILAYKCAAVAKFRVLIIKSSAISRDRTDLLHAMLRVPLSNQPPTGESPSSSSASDLDNVGQEKLQSTAAGKGAVSPSALQPTLTRFINNTGDMIEAFEHWNKAESLLATLLTSKMLSSEVLATVQKVANIGFSDVEGLVRLVNQALEAQAAFQQQTKGR